MTVEMEKLAARPWYRLPVCWLGMCGCITQSDDTGCWGECVHCHRRFGFVDRATLRWFADAEARARPTGAGDVEG